MVLYVSLLIYSGSEEVTHPITYLSLIICFVFQVSFDDTV